VSLHSIKLGKNRSKGFFYGWWIVLAGFLTNAFGVGTFYYGFSTFFNPMIAEFRCSRALMSGVYSLARLEGGIEGPIARWLIDRFGARKMMQIGITLVGIGYMMLYLVKSPLGLYLIFGLVLSLGYNLGYTHAAGAAIAKWFTKKRGRALSIVISGNGIGGAIFVPLLAGLIIWIGWRWAAVVIGLATFAIPLPLSATITLSRIFFLVIPRPSL
jgi:MFS family permease